MKKVTRSMPKEMNKKLKEMYADSPMGEWLLQYHRISFHELAVNRTAKKQITNRSYGRIGQ